VDLENETVTQTIDWDDGSISWDGRGGDRGLRGIALYNDALLLAASNELFIYSKSFEPKRSFSNQYLAKCHETCLDGDTLILASTGYDSILEFDLRSETFTRGYCLRGKQLKEFDPNGSSGPEPGDTLHINSVTTRDGNIYFSGTRLNAVLKITGGKIKKYGRIPVKTHNARPHNGGIIYNDTADRRICVSDKKGRIQHSFPITTYKKSDLKNAHLPQDHAQQAWGRGLCLVEDKYIIGGSSPATISVYEWGSPKAIKTVNLTLDVRNAVHGLELWPG